MALKHTAVIVIAAGLLIPVHAQWAVVDVAAIGKLVEQINEAKKRYQALIDMYGTLQDQYAQMQWNAQYVTNKSRWARAYWSWRHPRPRNRYPGKTGTWVDAVMDGNKAQRAWLEAVAGLPDYAAVWSEIPAPQQDRISTNYASIELADAAGEASLGALGDVRGVAADTDRAITDLETHSLSGAPHANTEVAVLNKINAAGILQLRNQQDQMRLATSALELALIQQKMQRDAMALTFETDYAIRQGAGQLHQTHLGGSSAAVRAMKLP